MRQVNMIAKTALLLAFGASQAVIAHEGSLDMSGSEVQESHSPIHRLEGTWLVEVTRRDCVAGTPSALPFAALNTFTPAGGLIEAGVAAPPSNRTAGQGTWRRIGRNRFQATFTFLLFPDGISFGAIQQVTRTITITGASTFEAQAQVTVFDPSGAIVVGQGCATETARRIG